MRSQFRRAGEILRTEGPVALVAKVARRGYRVLAASHSSSPFVPQNAQERNEVLAASHSSSPCVPQNAQERNEQTVHEELRSKPSVMRGSPLNVTIESTSFCNLKCVMYAHALPGAVTKRHFGESLLERLTPFLGTASRFQLHGLGEPLMSPVFWSTLEKISALHDGTPDISINTNGLLLTEKNIARLLASKVRELSISFDAATAETYEKIRGSDFSKVLDNVSSLVRAKKIAGRIDFKIMINMTLMRANIEELPAFVRLAKRLDVDQVVFWRMNEGIHFENPAWVVAKDAWTFSYLDEVPRHYPNLFNAMIREALRVGQEIEMPFLEPTAESVWVEGENLREDKPYRPFVAKSPPPSSSAGVLSVIEMPPVAPSPASSPCDAAAAPKTYRIDAASPIPAPKSPTVGKCQAPWTWLMVTSGGDCLPCCHITKPVGNLHDQSAEEIWNGATMQEIRKSIAKDEVHPLCQGATCAYVRGTVEETLAETRQRA